MLIFYALLQELAVAMPIFQPFPYPVLFLINTITKELSWYIHATVDDRWCWSSKPFSALYFVSHVVLLDNFCSVLAMWCLSILFGFSLCFWVTENTQVHPQTAFSCAFRHVPGSCWSVAVKGFSLVTLSQTFGWHPCLVHQMECCQRAFPWKSMVRSVVTVGTRSVFSSCTQKITFSSPRSVFFIWYKEQHWFWRCTLLYFARHSCIWTIILCQSWYFKCMFLELHSHLFGEKTNSHTL